MRSRWITTDIHEAKLKQYDMELKRIEDKLKSVDDIDTDFYVTAGYIVQLTKHSDELFKCSKYEERRLLIKTILTNVTWDSEKLNYDYLEPFNLLAEMNESTVWGGLLDVFRTKLLEINNHSVINNIQYIFQNKDIRLSYT